MARRHYDAIVVGGGPAGSTCARGLVRDGARVLVVDRARFPRGKSCGGWITPPVVEAVGLDLEEYGRRHTLEPFYGFTVSRLGGRRVRVEYPRPVSYGILRTEFDHYLLRRCGAEVAEATPVASIRRRGREFVVNDTWAAPLLVGAGGHFCPVARYLGASLRRERRLVTLGLEVELGPEGLAACGVPAAFPEVVYFDDLRGYGWCFRKGRFLNVGVGRTQPRGLRRHLREFLQRMRARGILPADGGIREAAFRGHAYKLHYVTPRPYLDDGVLLVGDAAGLSYNFSGEGIRPAVESALFACEVARQARGDYSRERLLPYRDRLYRAYGRPLTGWRSRLLESLPSCWFQGTGRILLGVPALARRVLIDRLFLHHHEFPPGSRPRPRRPAP